MSIIGAPIRLAFSTDERFVHRTATALRSILAHASRPVDATILYSGIGNAEMEDFRASMRPFDAAVRFIAVDTERLRDLPVMTRRMSRAAYFRLLLPELMPDEVEKVLYLDSDIVCCGDITPLWDIDISAHAAGCVREPTLRGGTGRGFWRKAVPTAQEIESLGRAVYFNSGVMLINLRKWRSERISARTLDWRRRNANLTELHDQDALNAILAGDWLQLSARWNFTPGFVQLTHYRFARNRRRLDPVLIHISGDCGSASHRRLMQHHFAQTAWAGRTRFLVWREPLLRRLYQRAKWTLRLLHMACFPFFYGPAREFGDP